MHISLEAYSPSSGKQAMFAQETIAAIQQMAPVSFLATLEGAQPRLRAMTHYVDDDLTIWYPSLKRSGKVDQILKNPHVAVSFVDTTWGRAPITVYGTAELIEDQQVKHDIIKQYGDSIRGVVPADPASENFVLIKITPHEVVDNTYRQS